MSRKPKLTPNTPTREVLELKKVIEELSNKIDTYAEEEKRLDNLSEEWRAKALSAEEKLQEYSQKVEKLTNVLSAKNIQVETLELLFERLVKGGK